MDIPKALNHGWPNARGWTLNGDIYAGLDWPESIGVAKPTEAEVAKAWSDYVSARAAAAARKASINGDAMTIDLIGKLESETAAQISAYIDDQVIDLPSVRRMLKRIVLVLAHLAARTP